MRGKTGYNSRHYDQYRITPAYAGKKSIVDANNAQAEDHPRLCGEKLLIQRVKQMVLGSPPPMRGKN